MAQVTSPIILDSTGQQIHSDLQQIKNVLTTPSAAADITFDNTGTGMQADDVQDAITELKSNLTDLGITYLGHPNSGQSLQVDATNYDFYYCEFVGYDWWTSRIILCFTLGNTDKKFYFNDVDGSYKALIIANKTTLQFQNVNNFLDCFIYGVKIKPHN